MRKKIVFITGITGQDGFYLSEFLLSKNYEIYGLAKEQVFQNELSDKVKIYYGDITNHKLLGKLIIEIKPDEIYHLAAQSRVDVSFKDDFKTFNTNTNSVYYLLSAIKNLKSDCKMYFVASSEMFGKPSVSPQEEKTPFNPVSPYGISKAVGFHLVKMFRDAYGIFACSGILFNHESPRRPYNYVTRKITSTAAKIKLGLENELRLGNLDAKRDWGFAGDYIEAMWLMLQQDKPDDYVIGTGESHSIRDFLDIAFGTLDLDWEKYVVIDKEFFRPVDPHELVANPAKAEKVFGWKPKTKFPELVKMMVLADLKALENKNQS